ncbi:MFS general substrate transporter [Meredithblackwellia eburnea MCA 4105]
MTLTNRQKRQALEAKLGFDLPPGTEVMHDIGEVHFSHREGSEMALVPAPSDNLDDPLNWSRKWKLITTLLMNLFCFVQCFGVLACGLFTEDMIEEWGTSAAKVAYFTSAISITLGWGNCIFIPLAQLHGTRLMLTIGTALCSASYLWQALAKSYGSFLGARLLNGLGACLVETIGPMVCEQIFFVHERGTFIGLYFACLFASTSVGPFMAAVFVDTVGWRNFWWLQFAASMALQVGFIFYPETKYHRTPQLPTTDQDPSTNGSKAGGSFDDKTEADAQVVEVTNVVGHGRPARHQFGYWVKKAPEESYAFAFLTTFKLVTLPACLWAGFLFAAVAVITFFLSVLQSVLYPSVYGFGVLQTGYTNWVLAVTSCVGSALAGPFSDWYMKVATKRNGNIREAEMRLPSLIPFLLCACLGMGGMGIGLQRAVAWPITVIVAQGLAGIGVTGCATICLGYAVDCHPKYAGQGLLLATLIKNSTGFGLGFGIVDWATTWGWQSAMGFWAGLCGFVGLFAIPLYIWGKDIRRYVARTSPLMKDE